MKFEIDIKNKFIYINESKLNFKMLYDMTFIEDETPYNDDKIIEKIKENIKLHYDKNKELWIIFSIKDFKIANNYLAYNTKIKKEVNFCGFPLKKMLKRLNKYKEISKKAKLALLNEKFEKNTFEETINALDALI